MLPFEGVGAPAATLAAAMQTVLAHAALVAPALACLRGGVGCVERRARLLLACVQEGLPLRRGLEEAEAAVGAATCMVKGGEIGDFGGASSSS